MSITMKHVLICVALFGHINCARILAYIPSPSISHQLPFRPLTQELARRGHEVVVITTDPAFPKGEAPANLTEIDLHTISYDSLFKNFHDTSRGKKTDLISQMELTFVAFREIIDVQLNDNEVKKVIFGPKFDLLILEAWIVPLLAISHIQKAPVIQMSSFGNTFFSSAAMGVPTHPILYPLAITRQRIYNLTIWEKITELYNHYLLLYLSQTAEETTNKMLRKHFGSDLPSVNELMNNIDMLFLNTHPIFEGNVPVPPGVVYVWGIHNSAQQELPHDIKTFLDSSKHGVIYMSFGTNTDPTLLPPEKIQMFVNVFCGLPYDVLWKWNNDELPGRCQNIKIRKWFPQSDLLRHPKVKAFITQGGLQSTDEAISAGVPLVGIPMLGDQWYNVEKYVHFRIGAHLDLEQLTEEDFKNTLTVVIDDKSYRENIRKLNKLMSDQPQSALERAVWWVEHVLRHGGARHLRAPAANISWAQYLELELVAVFLTTLTLALIVIVLSLHYISGLFRGNSKVKIN